MKREPSIHISKSHLIVIIEELNGLQKHGVVYSSEELVNKIFTMAKPYSIISRQVNVSNDRVEKKANRLLKSSRLDADLFARLVFAVRKQRKHRGISQIKPGGKDWDLVKEVTSSALNFCEEFSLKKRDGFIRYIDVGLSKMAKFNLAKFPNMYEAICETYEAIVEIENDNNPEGTSELYDYYVRHIADNTGIYEDIKTLPEKYVWFVRARKEADKIKVPYAVYIKAQFSGFDFAKGIPHPVQLVGPKAILRVNRYAYRKNFKSEYDEVGIRRVSLKGIFNDNDRTQ
jgi:hypothetical protein